MRRAAVVLALLLCLLWTGAQAHDQSSSQTQMSTDVLAELKELRDMAIEHRIKIQRLEQDNTVLETKMSSSEKEVEEVKRENADLLARVTASEKKSTAFEARMSSSEKEVEELQRENADKKQKLL
ncbi:hypothetical protein JOQ06_012913 [Pogonophryne albipinna]|uniref:Uncharacterized protein n=1 Tax=Pogonophryne albipinna TaxID=1090488 RepID=A0AAD6BIL4_9TELE|nr:hypothetical protein JOQ06_012913 [Pogonophryne albipinna]